MSPFRIYYCLPVFALLGLVYCNGDNDKDGFISEKEVAALDKLRTILGDELYLDYMKTNEWLVRWIRDQKYNLNATADKIRRSIKWRKANKIDTIGDEDFSDVLKLCPYTIDGHDEDNRPIVTFLLGQCDPRRLVLTGNLPRLNRMIYSIFEKSAQTVRKLRTEQGLHVHRIVIIVDIGGFNLRQHICLRCLSLLSTLLETAENNYPASFKNAYFINIPRLARPFVDLAIPVVSRVSLGSIKTFGYDKEEWSKELLKTIRPDQLPTQLGGTKGVTKA